MIVEEMKHCTICHFLNSMVRVLWTYYGQDLWQIAGMNWKHNNWCEKKMQFYRWISDRKIIFINNNDNGYDFVKLFFAIATVFVGPRAQDDDDIKLTKNRENGVLSSPSITRSIQASLILLFRKLFLNAFND